MNYSQDFWSPEEVEKESLEALLEKYLDLLYREVLDT